MSNAFDGWGSNLVGKNSHATLLISQSKTHMFIYQCSNKALLFDNGSPVYFALVVASVW